jgi:hypothetical protein
MRAAVRLVGGLRPAGLIVLGLAWISYGYRIVVDERYSVARGLASITRYVPLSTLGWVWVGAGAIGVLGGLLRSFPWQSAGYAALVTPAVLWGVANARAAMNGYPAATGSAAAWLGMGLFTLLMAGTVEPLWVVEARRRKGADVD